MIVSFMQKPVSGVSDQIRHKPGCTATEDGKRLEISDLESFYFWVGALRPNQHFFSYVGTFSLVEPVLTNEDEV